MNKIIYTLALFLAATGLRAQQSETFKWMEGAWKINTGEGQVVETWKLINDSTLAGKSVFVTNKGDTVPQETLELKRRNGQWTYVSTVVGQNRNLPVSFKVIFQRGTEFISENPLHDFPQRIEYRRIGNLMYASIEGKRKGKFSKQHFDFTAE